MGAFVYSAPMARAPSVGVARAAGPGPATATAASTEPPSTSSPAAGAGPPDRRGERPGLVAAAALLALAVPLVIALVALAHPRWYPVLDNAQTELRLRDVGTGHPPLIGLGGRIGTAADPGSHPGPISFWALWPFYQLFGASSWAMSAASVCLHLLAMATILWIAARRGGARLVIGAGAVLAVLAHAYGAATMIEPWNPYMPVLWWVAFLMACWSVLADDLAMAPVAALAGSFCAQTHIPYLGLVVGVGAITVLGALALRFTAAQSARRSSKRVDTRMGEARSAEGGANVTADAGANRARWLLMAAGVGLLAWLPPVIDELAHSPGNLSIILEHFSQPPEEPIGVGGGLELILLHLNPWRLLTGQQFLTGSTVPGIALLAVWAGTVALAWRRRDGVLLPLHAVLAAALALGVLSASRIFGFVWFYLVLWAWGITALLLLAVGWTVAVEVSARLHQRADRTERAGRAGLAVLAAATLVLALLFGVDAARVDAPAAQRSQVLGRMVGPTVDALAAGRSPGGGRDGRYLVTWTDPVHIGAHGYGLLNELERAGFEVGIINGYRAAATAHRVMDPGTYTAVVHMSVGPDIAAWRAKPGVEQVAYVEPRSPAQRAEYTRLRARAIRGLRAAGLDDLVSNIDGNLFLATFDPRVPEDLKDQMVRMADLGLPFAVFVGPPSAAD